MADAVQNEWFWSEVEGDVGQSLDEKARAVIDNALKSREESGVFSQAEARPVGSDIRLSFFSHYLVLKWGREKRSQDRLLEDRKNHPIFTRQNITTLLVTWTVALAGMYMLTSLAVYFLSFALQP